MVEISKTHIENRMRQKTNPLLKETIVKLKKDNVEVAKLLAMPSKVWPSVNLSQLNVLVKEGDKVFVFGKILASGELDKKIKIVAWNASGKALDKIKNAKCEFIELVEEMKKNPKLKDLKILQ